ncbi:hypothetical protein A5745_18275 [Mycobacterium sp. IS-2888]|nr:hypothetical protein A5745_18275 [Mycobacterium sp. IS-2888]
MYIGPGPTTLLTASAGWQALAAGLHAAASRYQSVITGLTDESWTGPSSMSMVAAVAPFLAWMTAIAAQCEEAAGHATAAAAAYETAFALTVPPPTIVANRAQLMTLVATNLLGQNTPAIMATEAAYSEMWAQDATAMYNYAANSASASAFTTFTPPPQTTNPGGPADQAGAVAQAAGAVAQAAGAVAQAAGAKAPATSTQLISSVPQALQSLSTPGSSSALGLSPTATGGTAASVGSSGLSGPLSAPSSSTDTSGKTGAGLGLDGYGLSLDFGGLGSITGTDGGAMSGLGSPGHLGGVEPRASASFGDATSLGTLSVPPSWADALAIPAPQPVLDANVMPGGWGAMPSPTSGAGVSKLPLGGMVGRESDGAIHRIGFRSSLIRRSPVAG